MSAIDNPFMQHALMLAKRAGGQDEVPVGAVVVVNNEIVGEGWNQPIGLNDASAHAEIMALRDAGQNLQNYRFPGADLYVTLEPCVMCVGAIVHARINHVYFATTDPRTGAAGSAFDLLPSSATGFNHLTQCSAGGMAEESSTLLKNFFRARR